MNASDLLIQLNPADPVAIARTEIPAGARLRAPDGSPLTAREMIPAGHKLALVDLPAGAPVLRYGALIGRATVDIAAGAWVHMHNLAVPSDSGQSEIRVTPLWPVVDDGLTFMGYPRPRGRAGVRNYIAVIATVNCATHVATRIARHFTPEIMAAYPNVDGVVPIVHSSGCALPPGGLSKTYLKRVLGNLDRNPNVAAAIYVGLGCEVMQLDDCLPVYTAEEMGRLGPEGFVIQDQGGFQRTVAAGITSIERLLPQVNAAQRVPVPLSNLTLALQCGGSDGWSGVTANPLMGRVVDAVVRAGGTAVLAETPEIYGAEGLLLRRVTGQAVADKLIERLRWWSDEAQRRGFSLDNNPAPGNKVGGLTNIFEKSLGAVAKAGSSPLNAVYEYGEWVDARGLVFMDSPGNDPFSVTGEIGGGCNLVLFSTGRGSLFGSTLSPTIKLASNSVLFNRMPDDMDFNAGRLLDGESWEALTHDLLEQMIAVASGRRTHSESHGLPETEFVPWQPDAVL